MFHLADIWAVRTGNAVRVVSANDHVHAHHSAHYQGLALDFLVSDPDRFAEVMRGEGYKVLWKVPGHYGHIHVQAEPAPPAVPAPAVRHARNDAADTVTAAAAQ
jgi:hypothetical protein